MALSAMGANGRWAPPECRGRCAGGRRGRRPVAASGGGAGRATRRRRGLAGHRRAAAEAGAVRPGARHHGEQERGARGAASASARTMARDATGACGGGQGRAWSTRVCGQGARGRWPPRGAGAETGRTAHGEYAGRGRGEVGASPRVCRARAAGVEEEAETNDAGEGIRRGSSPARPSGSGEVEIRRGIPRNGGVQGDGVGEPADDGARGDDGVRSGRRRGAQGGPMRWRLVAAGTGDAGEACGGDGRGSGWFGPDPIWIGRGSEWGGEWVDG